MSRIPLLLIAVVTMTLAACGKDSQDAPGAAASEAAEAQRSKAREELYAREKRVVEEASWFGKTGLGPTVERELPRFVRHELGQVIFDKDSLKAEDLQFAGAFTEHGKHVYFWQFKMAGSVRVRYAVIRVSHTGGVVMSVSNKSPKAEKR